MSATLVPGREEAKDDSIESDNFQQLDAGRLSGFSPTSGAHGPGGQRTGRFGESRGNYSSSYPCQIRFLIFTLRNSLMKFEDYVAF